MEWRAKVSGALSLKNQILVKVYNRRAIDVDEVIEEPLGGAQPAFQLADHPGGQVAGAAGCRQRLSGEQSAAR